MSEELPEQPEMPIGQMLMPIVLLIGMSLLLINETIRTTMANVAGSILGPVLPFHDDYFVPTVWILGSSIMIVNTVIRSLFMDPMKQAHLNHRNKQLRKLLNEARLSRDNVRMEKVQKMQMYLMPETTKNQMAMMKPMMFTMIFIIAVFSWMYLMVEEFRVDHVSLPWASAWGFENKVIIFPAWIACYITMSAPLGRLVDRHIKLFRFKRNQLVVEGTLIDEPLLVLLKDKRDGSAGRRRTRQGQRRMRGGKKQTEHTADDSVFTGTTKAAVMTGVFCPTCDSDSVERAASGRLRCMMCREEWRR